MKVIPAARLIRKVGMKGAIAPPMRALMPSIKAKARSAPMKTDRGLCLALRLTTAICVLSPNSAIATMTNEDRRGSKSNVSLAFVDFCLWQKTCKRSI